MPSDLIYDLEVDVVVDRSSRPWRERTHHVRLAIPDQPSLTRAEIEARNLAAWMVWGVRGDLVTTVRIVGAVL